MTRWLEHWQAERFIGQWDVEVRLPDGRTQRFWAKDKGKGYAITKQMEYEGEWRVLGGIEQDLSDGLHRGDEKVTG